MDIAGLIDRYDAAWNDTAHATHPMTAAGWRVVGW
jgi:hypothetical protein